jgi:hypothetical protein
MIELAVDIPAFKWHDRSHHPFSASWRHFRPEPGKELLHFRIDFKAGVTFVGYRSHRR